MDNRKEKIAEMVFLVRLIRQAMQVKDNLVFDKLFEQLVSKGENIEITDEEIEKYNLSLY